MEIKRGTEAKSAFCCAQSVRKTHIVEKSVAILKVFSLYHIFIARRNVPANVIVYRGEELRDVRSIIIFSNLKNDYYFRRNIKLFPCISLRFSMILLNDKKNLLLNFVLNIYDVNAKKCTPISVSSMWWSLQIDTNVFVTKCLVDYNL
ncbi:hypothetical protein DBV15_11389 [Temnothorax longispinosus]|uniref:Uncharacterized protein n=1 Tax=Temnothorax longispinosus TaxID=300112 RepID=A0A4V3SAD0_9HYME|nr:hypothetical protein DBV15_11389 [Temnothorax longispinosus]